MKGWGLNCVPCEPKSVATTRTTPTVGLFCLLSLQAYRFFDVSNLRSSSIFRVTGFSIGGNWNYWRGKYVDYVRKLQGLRPIRVVERVSYQHTDPAPDTRSVTSFPRCSYDWPKFLPTFLRNNHTSSSQSFQHSREPNSATLKEEAAGSSETLKWTFPTPLKNPEVRSLT